MTTLEAVQELLQKKRMYVSTLTNERQKRAITYEIRLTENLIIELLQQEQKTIEANRIKIKLDQQIEDLYYLLKLYKVPDYEIDDYLFIPGLAKSNYKTLEAFVEADAEIKKIITDYNNKNNE